MNLTFEDMETRLFSPRVWRGMAPPVAMGPWGGSYVTASGNSAFGFFDDFLAFSETTLVGPYANLATADGDITKVADTAAAKGILQFAIVGDTAEDETVLKWGSTTSAPFYLANNDLAFECCLSISSIDNTSWNIAVGLGQADMITTDLLFTDGDILADKNFCGFVKLVGEAGVFDGAYKADGQTYQDGATKTKLNALATFEADVTSYIKLGIRYRANPKKLEFYVDGVMPGGNITPARLTASELDAATFPDDSFMAPIIGIKDSAGNAALSVKCDWWACAQME